jgi:hypothetical protein
MLNYTLNRFPINASFVRERSTYTHNIHACIMPVWVFGFSQV